MTEERLVLAALLEKTGEGDFLRAMAAAVLQLLMETDVEGVIGAGRYERSGERTTWRNGHRRRTSAKAPRRSGSRASPKLVAARFLEGIEVGVVVRLAVSAFSAP
jgi:transposase-like protein